MASPLRRRNKREGDLPHSSFLSLPLRRYTGNRTFALLCRLLTRPFSPRRASLGSLLPCLLAILAASSPCLSSLLSPLPPAFLAPRQPSFVSSVGPLLSSRPDFALLSSPGAVAGRILPSHASWSPAAPRRSRLSFGGSSLSSSSRPCAAARANSTARACRPLPSSFLALARSGEPAAACLLLSPRTRVSALTCQTGCICLKGPDHHLPARACSPSRRLEGLCAPSLLPDARSRQPPPSTARRTSPPSASSQPSSVSLAPHSPFRHTDRSPRVPPSLRFSPWTATSLTVASSSLDCLQVSSEGSPSGSAPSLSSPPPEALRGERRSPVRVLFIGSPAVALSALKVLLASSRDASSALSSGLSSFASVDITSSRPAPAGESEALELPADAVFGAESPQPALRPLRTPKEDKRGETRILGLPGGFVVSAVLCRAPSRRGRGRRTLVPCPVQSFTEALSPPVPLFSPADLSSPTLLSSLQALSLDLAVCAAFGQKLPESILRLPRHGSVLLHPSLLPRYRGAAPVRRALLNGERHVGVSLLRPSPRFDEGPLLHQLPLRLAGHEHAEEIEEKLFQRGAQALLSSALWTGSRAGGGTGVPQDASKASSARKIRPEDRRISFSGMSASEIHNVIRAVASHGSGVWTNLEIFYFLSELAASPDEGGGAGGAGAATESQAGRGGFEREDVAPGEDGRENIKRATIKVKLLRTRLGFVPAKESDAERRTTQEELGLFLPSRENSLESAGLQASHALSRPASRSAEKGATHSTAEKRKPWSAAASTCAYRLSREICLDVSGALRFVCGDGSVLLVDKLQRESRAAMSGREFWNGLMGFGQERRQTKRGGAGAPLERMCIAEERNEIEGTSQTSCFPQKRPRAVCLRWTL
ncbi:formyl transferase domain-containing protein [Besnoitia besnoiti]|uniref:Formyl transferase domain-containing protein n=1 Tax=Besnoitia besnoiti TaxID=94643 RepID=A0A2A9MN60_BESBE|nr:formyl transferase domain-containing protein [Besnoitia besnoiti]PFH37267.1 formyl transferase domain-containing protein [Besnoitia besnoiti]